MMIGMIYRPVHADGTATCGGIGSGGSVSSIGSKYGLVTCPANILQFAWWETEANGTIFFNVSGYELAQVTYIFTVQSYGNGTLILRFFGVHPVRVQASSVASYSYDSIHGYEAITYSASQTSSLIVIYAGNPELKNVLFLDDFIHGNPLLSSSWTIDNYAASGTIPGEYTSAGFLSMIAQSSSSVETVHVNNPIAYNPGSYSGLEIVKRKLTASLYPFQKKDTGNNAAIMIGMSPLLTSGAYPSTTPQNTPFVDLNINCVSPAAVNDAIGTEYIQMYTSGDVKAVSCGDGGFNRFNLVNGLDPTLYTVFTVETSGIFCKTCTDNTFSGSAWVWFRVYQNDGNGAIIASTDTSLNMTSNIAPLFQKTYVFASLQNNNGAATHQTSYIDLVQLQNYGSPVCLFGCLPPVIEVGNLPPPLSSIWAGLVNLAAALGQGDIGFGSMILFGIFTLPVILTYAATRSTMLVASEFLGILGLLMASGLFGSIWVFGIVLSMGYLAFGIIKKMFLSSGMGGGGGGEGEG